MWTLTRRGVVKTIKTSPNQCRHEGWQEYQYEVKIKCKTLDGSGWVIEHSEVQSLIESLFQKEIGSCEEMTKTITSEINTVGKGRFVSVRTLLRPNIPNPPAWMEYED